MCWRLPSEGAVMEQEVTRAQEVTGAQEVTRAHIPPGDMTGGQPTLGLSEPAAADPGEGLALSLQHLSVKPTVHIRG